MKNFGKNLTWFLSQVAIAEPEQFETGEIEIYGEDEQGREGSIEVDITELVLAAQRRIERPSMSSTGIRPDIAVFAKSTLVNAEEMTINSAVMGLRYAIQEAEQFGMVRTVNGKVITGAVASEHGIVLTEN